MATTWSKAFVALTAAALLGGCGGETGSGGGGESLQALMRQRGLSENDARAALLTYTPTGKHDEYMIFASGGHSGQAMVIGVPSMRILKVIGVFTPEPWQGYGYGDQTTQLVDARGPANQLAWADTHHPALSETGGEYDGQFMFLNDKNSARIAVIDLRDFITTQIVSSGLLRSNHGAAFVTPNTENVIEVSQYPSPLGGGYAPIETYNERYRGAAIFWKFDRAKRRIIPEQSWAIELPPYMQDIADAGKGPSEGWVFINSINTERSWGGNMEGRPSLESGASQNDMDYLHILDWRKAEGVVRAGKTRAIGGFPVVPLETAIAEGLLHFVGEPKSPHGVDISPDGESIVVSGKLDTHCTVYSFAKLRSLIEAKTTEGQDGYGVPILPFAKAITGQVKIGLGPLHTQFGPDGECYTSLFLESAVARWSLKELRVLGKIQVHYNVGHLVAAEGDTTTPDGRFLVSMNKWALDRFANVGPLLPQNFQLIDISGQEMQLLYDMPLPVGEPHYAQMIKADKIKPIKIYSPAGTDPLTHAKDQHAVEPGKERIERAGNVVRIYMTAVRSHFKPDIIRVRQGDTVHLHITNIEQAHDATHGFALAGHNINLSLEPGEHNNVTFVASQAGVFPIYCTEFCSALHLEMAGYLLVEPAE